MNRQSILFVAAIIGVATCFQIGEAQELVTVNRHLMLKEPLPVVHLRWGDSVIFPSVFGDRFLLQCSRSTLGKGDSYWAPVDADVEKAEAIFSQYRKLNRPTAELLLAWPDLRTYHRQVVGVVRGGKKTLYSNFLPSDGIGKDDWRQQPLQLCDGGPSYFGVEIDLEASAVAHIDFDGCMCAVVPANKPLQGTRSKQRASER